VISLGPERIAEVMGARITSRGSKDFPTSAVIDSRAIGGGELFFGIKGESEDGGRFAPAALDDGAWGVVVEPVHSEAVCGPDGAGPDGWVFVV
jgi:UDP-N-acetylmuramyl pentapeptide synthase